MISYINNTVVDIQRAYANAANHNRVSCMVRWSCLPAEFVKINVDGSAMNNLRHAGFGGVIRNDVGEWVIGFSGYPSSSTNLHAELKAVWFGLQLAWDRGCRYLVCHSDSTTAIHLVLQDVPPSHKYSSIVRKIEDLLRAPWEVILEHTYREGNACADWLPKHDAKHDDPTTLWEQAPPNLNLQPLADALGVRGFKSLVFCFFFFFWVFHFQLYQKKKSI